MSTDLKKAKKRLFHALRREVGNNTVIEAMERVPRELFVADVSHHLSYEDIALPIGGGQTISQPYIVALMTSALELNPKDSVLELGTGSGYQAAILSHLVRKVCTVERVVHLAEGARKRLASLGCLNVEVRLAGDELGCTDEAPFDAINVTAGAPRLPRVLLDQMAHSGRMVLPVGSQQEQNLIKVVRTDDGYSIASLGQCRFVPLVGKGAWDDTPSES